jgi:phage tail-like protein
MSFGEKRVLHDKFKFVVQSLRFGFSAFQKMGEISMEAANIEYFEGGALIPIKRPGRITIADVTLERGASNDFDMHNWFLDVADVAAGNGGQGLIAPAFKTDDLAVIQRERDDSRVREWGLVGAYPNKYVAGDWDNTVDEVVIEQLTLRYDFPQRVLV